MSKAKAPRLKNKKELYPLQVTKEVFARFPKIAAYIELIKDTAIQMLGFDYSFCDYPTEIIENVLKTENALKTEKVPIRNIRATALKIQSALTWNKNKQVFSFDNDMAGELINSFSVDDPIPMNIFNNIPFDGMYIESKGTSVKFFVTRDMSKNGMKFLNFYSVDDITEIFPLTGQIKSLRETMDVYLENFIIQEKTESTIQELMEFVKNVYHNLSCMLPLLIYLCADNAQVEYKGSKVKKENGYLPKEKTPTNHFSKSKQSSTSIVKIDVGIRIGKAIRQYNQVHKENAETNKIINVSAGTGLGVKKSPHIRRGHYHHYWTGRKDGSEERRLILKWIPPTFINIDIEKEDIKTTTIHNVKK